MRILQVHTPYRQIGGEDVAVAAEAALLRAAGHEVVQHFVPNPEGAARTAAALATSPYSPAQLRAVRRAVHRLRPDVAHVHNTWFALTPSAVRGLRRSGVPVAATVHNYRLVCANALLFRDGHPCRDCVGRRPWPGVVHRCYHSSVVASAAAAATIAVNRSRWARDVDVFAALTGFARDQLVASGFPADKIVVKPNFVPEPGPRMQPPSAFSTVLYVGRLSVGKGLETLLQAWRLASVSRVLTLQVIGDGPLRAALAAQAGPSVEFLGEQSRESVLEAMRFARALVFPSVSFEGPSLTVLEAFATGLPVVASATAGTPEVLENPGQRGWLAAPGDVTDWASRLEVLADDAAVDRAGAGGRALYEGRYAPQVGLANLLALYDRARSVSAE